MLAVRNLYSLNEFRLCTDDVLEHYGSYGDDRAGVFSMPSPTDGKVLHVVASAGVGWDHVSVSRKNRCPNWQEMQAVKRRFFEDGETAMQLHVPATEHISCHPYCLHMWRPHDVPIPRPPGAMVA